MHAGEIWSNAVFSPSELQNSSGAGGLHTCPFPPVPVYLSWPGNLSGIRS